MRDVKVYIIDPSVLVRQTIANIVGKSEGATVTGASASISPAGIVENLNQLKADVVIMSLNSVDSAEAKLFLEVRSALPDLPVIVLSPRSPEGAKAVLFALKKGAVEYVTKPAKRGNLLFARFHLEKRLVLALGMIPRLNIPLISQEPPDGAISADVGKSVSSSLKRVDRSIELVVVGGCTGGVQSLFPLIGSLPAELSVPVIVVQHMPKIYTRVLAEELDAITPFHVREAVSGSKLLPGQVYLAPGGYHVSVKNDSAHKQISLHRGPKEHKCRPSLDVLLRSVRQAYKGRVLTVYLSGGGSDGLRAARDVSAAGGQVILQNQASALLWDLPARIYEYGYADGMYNIEELGAEIAKRVDTAGRKASPWPPDLGMGIQKRSRGMDYLST